VLPQSGVSDGGFCRNIWNLLLILLVGDEIWLEAHDMIPLHAVVSIDNTTVTLLPVYQWSGLHQDQADKNPGK
jgi:uncharacterized protein YrrD